MKRTSHLFIVFSLFSSLLWNGCAKDDENDQTPALLTITSFIPTSGVEATTIIISGTNFSTTPSLNVVTFNGTAATVMAATSTQLTATVPSGATTGKIAIAVNGRSVTSANDFTVEAKSPSIISFTPTSGLIGTTVTITGTNFKTVLNENLVKFNGIAATVTTATPTSLTVIVPTGASTGKITVQVGALTTISTDDFIPYLPTTVSTLAGSISGYLDGTGTAAMFNLPTGVAVDGSGNVYVTDFGNNIIRKITAAGLVSTLAGNGAMGFNDGASTAAQFYNPYGIAVDASGNVYVADYRNHAIRKITPNGEVNTLAGSTNGYVDGTRTTAKFQYPTGVAVDALGNVYVADRNNHCIRKITSDGVVSTLAGNGSAGFSDGTGIAAQFEYPTDVAIDATGNVYVADANNNRIRKITQSGLVSTLAGSSTSGTADGIGTSAKFNGPHGVAVDVSGNVYVTDYRNNSIRKITQSGVVRTLAGSSTIGSADGTSDAAQFNFPHGITVDASGNIYVADRNNNRIRKIHQ